MRRRAKPQTATVKTTGRVGKRDGLRNVHLVSVNDFVSYPASCTVARIAIEFQNDIFPSLMINEQNKDIQNTVPCSCDQWP